MSRITEGSSDKAPIFQGISKGKEEPDLSVEPGRDLSGQADVFTQLLNQQAVPTKSQSPAHDTPAQNTTADDTGNMELEDLPLQITGGESLLQSLLAGKPLSSGKSEIHHLQKPIGLRETEKPVEPETWESTGQSQSKPDESLSSPFEYKEPMSPSVRPRMPHSVKETDTEKSPDGHAHKTDMTESSEERPPSFPSGEALLQSFLGRSPDKIEPQKISEIGPSLSDLSAKIADRILVSDTALTGKQEVRISLKDSTLAQTEIQITKEDGKIVVNLVTSSNDSLAFLTENRDSLQEHLSNRLTDPVVVTVKYTDSGAEDQQRRSRQHRNLYDEMQDS
jgi:type III secretion system needle length determinant